MAEDEERIARVDSDEQALALARFDLDDAWWLGCRAREIAAERKAPVAIVVAGASGWLFSSLLPGATQDNFGWIRRKFAVVRRFERSSFAVGLMFRARPELNDHWGLNAQDYALAGGAVPIRLVGAGVIGAVGISGVPQEIDHEIAMTALADLKQWQDGQFAGDGAA